MRCDTCSIHFCGLLSEKQFSHCVRRKGGSDGICGGLFPGDTRFSVGGQFAKRTIAAKWTAGSTVEIAIQIWTNHVSLFQT